MRHDLSPLQAAMLRGSLAESTGVNVEQVEIDFRAEVALDRVVTAWTKTVRKTTALQTGFAFCDGEPCGFVSVKAETAVRVENASPPSWESWLAADRLQQFPLDGGLPWRAVYWPQCGKFIWTFHHALLDGRSITKILRAFHARLIGADHPGRLELAVSIAPTSEDIAAAVKFHSHAFAELEASQLEYPADSLGKPAHSHLSLGREVAARIELAALEMEVSAPTLLTWAWGQAVARSAGADAVAVGQVRSGPSKPEQAGFSMSTVPLVIRRESGGLAKPVLMDFRKRLLAMRAIEHVTPQDLPPGIFQEAGGPWPGGVVMIERGTLHHQIGDTEAMTSITLHEFSGEPLLASAWFHPEMRLEVEVNGMPYGKRTADSLLHQWAAIVMAIADESSPDNAGLTSLPAAMQDSLANWESGGEASAHLHLAAAWREAAQTFSSRCAIWTPEASLSYAELDAQVDHLAAVLVDAGVKSGQTVASILWTRKHLAVVLLALARVGAINVPLDPALPKNRLLSILDDAGPCLILSDSPAACEDFSLTCITVNGMTGKTCTADTPGDPRATLSILYTSGSTGKPKGVMMVHGGVTNEAKGIAKHAGIGPGDRVLQFASPGFDASLEELLATLLSGATLVPRPENLASDLDEFQKFIRDEGITVLDLSTAHWAAWCAWMISENTIIPKNVRTTIIGGERASAAAVKDWFSANGRQHLLLNTYGPTEASVVGTVELIQGDWNESGDPAIGRPLPGVFARVGDGLGRTMPPGAAGELSLGGICVGAGYWQRQDLTDAAFHFMDDRWWYRTGDRVCWDESGKLRFLGRQDDQLKIRGNRVEPNEVVRVLESFPGVSSAHAGPVAGHGGSNLLAAWVRWNKVPEAGWPGLLAAYAAAHLPTAAIPTRWAVVEEFKLTERGKLDRRQLPEPLLTASTQVSSDPPVTDTEKWLARSWSGLLGIQTIGRDESFFELGGHSLAALQLFAGIAREWKIRIPMAALIQAPTPRMLGELIDRQIAGDSCLQSSHSMIMPIRPEGHLPPLFCIHGGDGGVFFYRDLAEQLPPGRPLLAIESPALASQDKVRPIPVEETAATYLAALRHHQATGPFHLIGYSYGGLLVVEIARLLMEQGDSVAFMGLFDTINPAVPVRGYTLMERAGVYWNSQENQHWTHKTGLVLKRICEGVCTHLRVKKQRYAARSYRISEPHSITRMLQIREAHLESMNDYQPSPIDCHVTLFKSKEPDDKFDLPDDYGWGSLAKSLDIVEVEGKHLTIFNKQHVGALACQITERL